MQIFVNFCKFLQIFTKFYKILQNFAKFLQILDIFRKFFSRGCQILQILDIFRFSRKFYFCEKWGFFRKKWNPRFLRFLPILHTRGNLHFRDFPGKLQNLQKTQQKWVLPENSPVCEMCAHVEICKFRRIFRDFRRFFRRFFRKNIMNTEYIPLKTLYFFR